MIRRRPDAPSPLEYLRTPSPESSSRSSVAVSDCDADDEDTMSMDDVTSTPPLEVLPTDESTRKTPYFPKRPTLPDVLSNAAPPPWTLSAFTAYLSSNHCLENLEFTLDAERYKAKYDELSAHSAGLPITSNVDGSRHMRMLWQRLIDAYIVPDCAREINIPSTVRAALLSLPNHIAPPNPAVLEDAVKIIYNLMEESVLVSFLNEVPSSFKNNKPKHDRPTPLDMARRKRGGSDSSGEKVSSKSTSRRRPSPSSSFDLPFSSSDPTGRLTPSTSMLMGMGPRASSHTSSGSGDPDSMTDDSASPSSPCGEPTTPPTTPPSSDFGGSSPRSRSDNTWKKMLGWKKKSSGGMRDSRFPTLED